MKIMVIGSGGREHALCHAILASPKCTELICVPGNGGIAEIARCIDITLDDIEGLVKTTIEENPRLVVIGPEGPLVLGLSDRLREAGFLVFGPSSEAAKIEGSKGYMKDLCHKYNIPTANSKRFQDAQKAREYIDFVGLPIVVKADGLAAGKGVTVCKTREEAFMTIESLMINKVFGSSGSSILIEEFLEGEELSFFALVNGDCSLPLIAAQDHKAAFDGGEGPNTGGMGAYSPTAIANSEMIQNIMSKIINPTVRGMVADGVPYQGVLFAGLMITKNGPKLIEYNCRFGDPECQVLMARLKSDALEMFLGTALGQMEKLKIKWFKEAVITVILASKGYPGKYKTGSKIKGCDKVDMISGVNVFHSGTIIKEADLIANGGRVLGITAMGSDLASARKLAYDAVDLIDWPDGFFRRDIGLSGLKLVE